jgi:hypothetical protein
MSKLFHMIGDLCGFAIGEPMSTSLLVDEPDAGK